MIEFQIGVWQEHRPDLPPAKQTRKLRTGRCYFPGDCTGACIHTVQAGSEGEARAKALMEHSEQCQTTSPK